MPARLIYSALTSLDGYLADQDGKFDWAAPDDDVHAFVNDMQRPIGTYLLGRRMYEVLLPWETMPTDSGPAVSRDFAAMWQSADKIVYSTTLQTVPTARTRLETRLDPDAVRALKESAERDVSLGGADLASTALSTGLVDELQLFLNPIVVGGGTAALPAGVRIGLRLLDEHRFANGVVFVRYACG